jgi:predicted nucleic acid-binding protein
VIFADTSFWVALRNRRDPRHPEASALLRSHADRGIVTSNHVRGETWTYLRRRAGHGAAVGFLDSLERTPRVRLVAASAKQEEDALRFLRQRGEREYSFVDATSFVLMKSLRIREALAFDGDFSAAGFVELRE